MRKKILSLALTLLLCAAMTVPASADWKESIPSYYEFGSDGYAKAHTISVVDGERVALEIVMAYDGPDEDLVLPDWADGVGDFQVEDSSKIRSITIPEGVGYLRAGCFAYFTGLKKVTMSDGITSIGERTFQDCFSLSSVNIPSTVTTIGEGAFRRCTSLASITIPGSVIEFGAQAFQGCSSLTNVTISSGVIGIGEGAFQDCTSLTSVTIPDSVTEIGSNAFAGCTSLTSVTIPNGCKIGEDAFAETPYALEGTSGQDSSEDISPEVVGKEEDTQGGMPKLDSEDTLFKVIIIAVAILVVAAILLVLKKKGKPNKKVVVDAASKYSQTTEQAKQAGGITCSCGTVNAPEAAFCSECGKPVARPGRCLACGHQNDPGAKFCQGCGKPLNGGED